MNKADLAARLERVARELSSELGGAPVAVCVVVDETMNAVFVPSGLGEQWSDTFEATSAALRAAVHSPAGCK